MNQAIRKHYVPPQRLPAHHAALAYSIPMVIVTCRQGPCDRQTASTIHLMANTMPSADHTALDAEGFVHIRRPFARLTDAWCAAQELVNLAAAPDDSLVVLGDYVIPPIDGSPGRDFQTLHFDFGLPLAPAVPVDVARYTALHLPVDTPPSDAVTRLVPLRPLLASGRWPSHQDLVERFAAYGDSHGARDITAGYVEGSFARIIEAVVDRTPVLPSVRIHPAFLCGTEFDSLIEETEFFALRGLHLDAVEIEVCVRPGELLVFDNLALAHGRRGTRRPGELYQRVFGHRSLPIHHQVELRDRVLAAFAM
jgi:hypothetical protein